MPKRKIKKEKWRKNIALYFLILFIISVIAWIFRMPHEPDRLYRAIPENALSVSYHESLPERLNSITDFLTSDSQEKSYAERAIQTQQIMRMIGVRETVVAYIPEPIGTKQPAWITASWIGRSSFLIRLSLAFGQFQELTRSGTYAGWTILELNEPLTPSGLKLSLATNEGLLLACISAEAAGVRYAIAAYEGIIPSIYHAKERVHLDDITASDKGLLRINDTVMSYMLNEPGTIGGTLKIHTKIPEPEPLRKLVDLQIPGKLLSDLPALVIALPLSTILEKTNAGSHPEFTRTFIEILRSDDLISNSKALILAALTGEYGGMMGKSPFRIRTPSLLAMFKTGGKDESLLINRLLDKLNSHYQLGLILSPTPRVIGRQHLWIIESTTDNMFLSAEEENRIACATYEDWFILSSNAKTLSLLLNRIQNTETFFEQGDWQKQIENEQTAALLWIDMEEASKALQLPLALWSMQIRSKPRAQNSPELVFAEHAKTLLAKAAQLQSCALRIEAKTNQPVIHISAGSPSL